MSEKKCDCVSMEWCDECCPVKPAPQSDDAGRVGKVVAKSVILPLDSLISDLEHFANLLHVCQSEWQQQGAWSDYDAETMRRLYALQMLLVTNPPLASGLDAVRAERDALRTAAIVPGVMHCAKCNFQLVRVSLNVAIDTVIAGDNRTEPCPNRCGPLWPMTWDQRARELEEISGGYLERLAAKEQECERLREAIEEAGTILGLSEAVDCNCVNLAYDILRAALAGKERK